MIGWSLVWANATESEVETQWETGRDEDQETGIYREREKDSVCVCVCDMSVFYGLFQAQVNRSVGQEGVLGGLSDSV